MVNNHFLNCDQSDSGLFETRSNFLVPISIIVYRKIIPSSKNSKGCLPKEVLRGSEETILVQFYDITHARAFLESNRFISRREKK